MWRRSVACLGVVLAVAGMGLAQTRQEIRQENRQARRDIARGEVVRVNPENNTVVVRTGTGAAAKEMEYRVGNDTRYWGTDKRLIDNGLRYNGFRAGTPIWYIPGENGVVSNVWFYEPEQTAITGATANYLNGTVVRVDPATNLVVVRTTGPDAREYEYHVGPDTRYWGTDTRPFDTGLRYEGFRPGARVWFRAGPKERLSELRFSDPNTVRPGRP